MKINLFILLTIIVLLSCKYQESEINTSPKLKLIDQYNLKFENQTLKYSQLDSILNEYLKVVPTELKDSISINLEVHSKEVTIQKVSEVKISLRKNRLLKINYKTMNDEK